MRVVVTGAAGFIGGHIVDALVRRGDWVQAWVRNTPTGDLHPSMEFASVDIVDPLEVASAMKHATPDVVVHLAAQSLPTRSWDDPAETYLTNVIGTISVLEASRGLGSKPRLLMAGSSSEYAELPDGTPIAETDAVEPNSPYAASKVAAEELAVLYGRRYGLEIVRMRPFFLVGPRKHGDVCSDFARQIVAIERGRESTMRVGRLDVIRDFLDVRDGVAAMIRLMAVGRPGEVYNICSGEGRTIGEVLAAYRKLAAVPLNVVEDPALLRPLEQRVKIGDPQKMRTLGWRRSYDLSETLQSILDYSRAAIG